MVAVFRRVTGVCWHSAELAARPLRVAKRTYCLAAQWDRLGLPKGEILLLSEEDEKPDPIIWASP
jgi:hypothetical protein